MLPLSTHLFSHWSRIKNYILSSLFLSSLLQCLKYWLLIKKLLNPNYFFQGKEFLFERGVPEAVIPISIKVKTIYKIMKRSVKKAGLMATEVKFIFL
jgi:hypothetical protein